MIFSEHTLEQASLAINLLRRYRPFRYGGTWWLVSLPKEVRAYRTKATAVKWARKHNLTEITELK